MTMLAQSDRRQTSTEVADVERFRLRRFLDCVREAGELDVGSDPLDLIDIASRLDGNGKAVLLRSVGRERAELVGNVMGSRRRLALAFGTTSQGLLKEILKRIEAPIPPVEVSSAVAPVHQVVLTGQDADFTRLPVHLQHSEDGGPYISASIDITRSFDGKRRNVGYRRLMLRGRNEAGMDLVAPSDLRAMYAEFVRHRERMPIAFAVGSQPADSVAAVCTWTAADEVAIMGAMRGAAVPLVRCATIDAMAPADAEIILEGYLDGEGWSEPEGPYGEFLGYYGHLKTNPVFHLSAITMRRDALFQTATIGGRYLEFDGHRPAQCRAHRGRRMGGADDGRSRAPCDSCRTRQRRRLQSSTVAAPARSRRGAQRHRGRVRLERRSEACVRGG